MKKILSIRPYARLLTMLGEQLIKNERIALIELIKNAYDADANWVKISFQNFNRKWEFQDNSKIIIEDDGEGMTLDIIENAWMNPATPNKLLSKQSDEKTKRKERIVQGEKGIGRFAILKLGKKIRVITRPLMNIKIEYVLDYDLSDYDDDFLMEKGTKKELYLDELAMEVTSRKPTDIRDQEITLKKKKLKRGNSGTKIEISNLKGSWSEQKIKEFYKDISKLESPFTKIIKRKTNSSFTQCTDFKIDIEINNEPYLDEENLLEKLQSLLENNAPLKVENGVYDSSKKEYRFDLNGTPKKLGLDDPRIRGLTSFRKRFAYNEDGTIRFRLSECGSFKFNFFVFDLSTKVPPKYQLDKEDKKTIKDHRVYLYRDGIRVYPYGDPNDDWLSIDTLRGIERASFHFSNDQIVGWIEISQKDNPLLKDKTNREGLLEIGNQTEDFIATIRSILSFLRQHEYEKYLNQLEDKKVQDIYKTDLIHHEFSVLSKYLTDKADSKGLSYVTKIEKDYKAEKSYLEQRAETVEQLAGVGLSVETASHDIMSIMGKALHNLDDLIGYCISEKIEDFIVEETQKIKGMMSFIESRLKDIQLLFRSSKQRRRNIRVEDILKKVIKIYQSLLNKRKINLQVEKFGSPLIVKCTDAVLLQLLINLFDNAIYWLETVDKESKQILITLNGDMVELIFSDNGPGVHLEDKPYIFEPFYSGKGKDGRGLGLYIARQLLERIDYSIELSQSKKDKKLTGANFLISFISEEKND